MSGEESPWQQFWRAVLMWLQVSAMVLAASILLLMQYESNISIPTRMCLDNSPVLGQQ